MIENWKTLHYRSPQLWESEDPEATLMKLRTVSLLPEETVLELQERFGAQFDALDHGRLALATAQIEGFVTNSRLQQISSQHPRDITYLLKGLVKDGLLVPDGQGRATSYRVKGMESVDLAVSSELVDRILCTEAESGCFEGEVGSSGDVAGRSEDRAANTGGGRILIPEDPVNDERLRGIAVKVRGTKRGSVDLIRSTVKELCGGHFLTLN